MGRRERLAVAAQVAGFAAWLAYFQLPLWAGWGPGASAQLGMHMARARLEGRYLEPAIQAEVERTGALPELPPTRASGWQASVVVRCGETGGAPGRAWQWCPERQQIKVLDGRGLVMFPEGAALPSLWQPKGSRAGAFDPEVDRRWSPTRSPRTPEGPPL